MAKTASHDVFLSYAGSDKPWVSQFVTELKKTGVDPWYDDAELEPGDRWMDKIQEALRESKTLIVILSKKNTGSPWTFFEIGAAIASKKRIIPVLTEDIDIGDLPVALRGLYMLKSTSPEEAGRRVAEVLGKTESEAKLGVPS
jgi:hypothetical protein